MITKNEVKVFLIITYVILDILSMIFNSFFTDIAIGDYYFTVNYSILFFCMSFFIVDLVNDFFSVHEANKFFYYKIFGQVVFLILCKFSISIYGLHDSQFSKMIDESPQTILYGAIATFFGYKMMNAIMAKMKVGIYQGKSIFRRYIYSTLPGEMTFSFVFSALSFSSGRNIHELLHIISTSCVVKIILSVVFAAIITFCFKLSIFYTTRKKIQANGKIIDVFDI